MITNSACFVCGTDTNVGKTFVCGGLLRNIPYAHGVKVIQTGAELIDQNVYLEAAKGADVKTLFHFPLAASPHLAAKQVGCSLNLQEVAKAVQTQVNQYKLTLIEGSGGVMSPITEENTFLDLITLLGYPVLLVVKNTLGAINQALVSINVLQSRGIKILGLILTQTTVLTSKEQTLITQDNARFIAVKSHLPVLAHLSFIADFGESPSHWEQIAKELSPVAQLLIDIKKENADDQLTAFDQQHLWHPYEEATSTSNKPMVKRALGSHLILNNGQVVVDGMSSWWSAIHGYSHPDLVKAAQTQCATLSHVMFGGLTHEPAIVLGKKLLPIVPKGLKHIFYTDSGSVAIEVALKMALQYWQGQGKSNKSKLISFYGGYHGDTFGAMSVCDPVNGMHHLFKEFLVKNIFAPRPSVPFYESFDEATLLPFKRLLEEHSHECAAVIIEPIVQGAGGMWFYHPEYLKAIRQLCNKHNLLLIVDEIATGFGRTGKLFACEWADISPDIMCIGKAITGGMLTLAATLTTQEVAQGISASGNPLMHGPTYMANPLACAVAISSIDLLLNTAWQEKVLQIEKWLEQGLQPCNDYSDVQNVRVLGAIGVVELKNSVNVTRLQSYFIEQGVWIRAFKNLIYIMPPYIVSVDEVSLLTDSICKAIRGKAWE